MAAWPVIETWQKKIRTSAALIVPRGIGDWEVLDPALLSEKAQQISGLNAEI